LLATLNPAGLPHLTLISSFMAPTPDQLVWGQFTEGASKQHVRDDPRTGFMIMTLDKRVWRGKANWRRAAHSGPEYEELNNTPMFRYNSYFGMHTVHYMALIEHSGCRPLPMNRVVLAAGLSTIARRLVPAGGSPPCLTPWTVDLFNGLSNLKFLAYVGPDGYPVIVPVIQAQCVDQRGKLLFSTAAFGEDLARIPAGVPMALFGMALTMEDVLLRGVYQGRQRIGGLPFGVFQTDWVYNAMPPVPGQIYPPLPLVPVRDFGVSRH
jgi:hypothetical protein